MKLRFFSLLFISIICVLMIGLALKTYLDIQPINAPLRTIISDAQMLQVTDRNGYPLTISYQNRWNTYDNLPLYQIPDFLKTAFITAEDQSYYQHRGIDWQARFIASWQNFRHQHTVRGASTITEQVVRMLHPRPRTLWSKWIEGFEANQLEKNYSKADILEFYLNQVPYAANRRGVLQAARYYFDRDLSTLTAKEMLALAVLARAPSSYDLYMNPERINAAIMRLAVLLYQKQQLNSAQLAQIKTETFELRQPTLPINASHFVNYIRLNLPVSALQNNVLHTTLDANLQNAVQRMLDERVANLRVMGVQNAAAFIVDHTTGEVLAWVVAGANSGNEARPIPGYKIDAVTVPRQPGSALKPFLYTLALQSGWTPATMIDDSPYAEAIGTGLHRFKNYSNSFYGPVTLREALGNSLNIPALRTIRYVGAKKYLDTLHALGFASLNRSADIYAEGLALGNGEVTLFELVRGYTTLANRGIYRPFHFVLNDDIAISSKRIFSAEATSLIASILSDPNARRLEFGDNSILNLPIQTAAKTGTSSDYRDAWAVGFNYRYAVGVWMGNLDRSSMNGVTGSIGPALVMRSIFAELNKNQQTSALYLSPKLITEDICVYTTDNTCSPRTEYFISGTEPSAHPSLPVKRSIQFVLPTNGLQIAIDPRIPRDLQKINFQLNGLHPDDSVDWILNDKLLATTRSDHYSWDLQKGQFKLNAVVHQNNQSLALAPITFFVK